jgi:hypothetical protein
VVSLDDEVTTAVISLNDDYIPPRRPRLAPNAAFAAKEKEKEREILAAWSGGSTPVNMDDSDLDGATANLFASLQLKKRKTPTPETTSEEFDNKRWLSTDPGNDTASTTSPAHPPTNVHAPHLLTRPFRKSMMLPSRCLLASPRSRNTNSMTDVPTESSSGGLMRSGSLIAKNNEFMSTKCKYSASAMNNSCPRMIFRG